MKMPPEAQECELGHAYAQTSRTLIPLGVQVCRMAYLKGPDDTVIGRYYRRSESGWQILTGTLLEEVVAEVEVPEKYFQEPDANWDARREWDHAGSACGEIGRQTHPPASQSTTRPVVESGEQAIDFVMRTMQGTTTTRPSHEGPSPNAGRYMLASLLVMAAMHNNSNSEPSGSSLLSLIPGSEAFRGMTREGYDFHWRDDRVLEGIYSGYRLRSIGPRRFRIEVLQFGLFFPTSFFGYGGATMSSFSGYAGGTRVGL
jgi:hypothetical protein